MKNKKKLWIAVLVLFALAAIGVVLVGYEHLLSSFNAGVRKIISYVYLDPVWPFGKIAVLALVFLAVLLIDYVIVMNVRHRKPIYGFLVLHLFALAAVVFKMYDKNFQTLFGYITNFDGANAAKIIGAYLFAIVAAILAVSGIYFIMRSVAEGANNKKGAEFLDLSKKKNRITQMVYSYVILGALVIITFVIGGASLGDAIPGFFSDAFANLGKFPWSAPTARGFLVFVLSVALFVVSLVVCLKKKRDVILPVYVLVAYLLIAFVYSRNGAIYHDVYDFYSSTEVGKNIFGIVYALIGALVVIRSFLLLADFFVALFEKKAAEAKEREVVYVDRVIEKEVVKEVPVEKIVYRDVIKEVPVEKIVYKDAPVEEDEAEEDAEETATVEAADENKTLNIKTRTYIEKLFLLDEEKKDRYNKVRNELESYTKVHERLGKPSEAFRFHGKLIAKMTVSGKTLRLHLALNPNQYPITRYHQLDLSGKRKFVDVPFCLKLKSNRSYKYAQELIAIAMDKAGATKNARYEEKDFIKELEVEHNK